jgi:hypothetical protein
MDQFSNREIAFGIWLIAFGCWLGYVTFSKPSVRASFFDLSRALANRKIIAALSLMATYIGLQILGLAEIGLWDESQLKNTIIWAISVAVVSLFRVGQIATDPNYFRNAIRDNLRLVVFLEFLVTFYSFELCVEILIVPAMTFVTLLLVVAQNDKKFAAVERLLNSIVMAFGLILVAFTAYKLVTDFGSFATAQTVSDFSTPTLLTLLYLPFTFVMAVYVSYENAFVALHFSTKDPTVRNYAKWRSILAIGPQTSLLRRWTREMNRVRPQTKRQVDGVFQDLRATVVRERNPPEVPLQSGWSPTAAQSFVAAAGLLAEDYHRVDDNLNHWGASSPYVELGDTRQSNLAYYIEGDAHTVAILKLVLNAHADDTSPTGRQALLSAATSLVRGALSSDLPAPIATAIASMSEATSAVMSKKLTLSVEGWLGKGGSTATFSIGPL